MSGSGETAGTSKYDRGTTPTPDKCEEDKGKNTTNIMGYQSLRRT